MSISQTARTCRVGIDVGGTFTDFVLVKMASGELTHFKEPSVPSDPSRAVETGILSVARRAGVGIDDIELVVHGTTLGLNAIIQRRGARIAMVVTKGFRDVLEIARARVANPYDFKTTKEERIVPRDLIFEADARIRASGEVLARPTDQEIDALAASLRDANVTAVAIMLLHSYLHPAMEATLAEDLRRRLPSVLIAASAQVWPEIREYERALVTVMNSYIHPLIDDYLDRLQSRLTGIGVTAPIYITASNGGSLSLATARERPVETILSGPASGVVAAARVAGASERTQIITFDMGGTSSDIALCKKGEPEYTTYTTVGELPLVLPVVNVSAIGSGGGSIVWVDPLGVLKVGPNSAGSDPGPVCYGRGGTQPTVTDCYLLVGYIDPAHFLGGRMDLDEGLARQALLGIADQLGLEGEDRATRAAESALRVATAIMATELLKGLSQRGEDAKSFTLMPFGGAGPTHANLLAREAGLTSVIVPRSPGTFCAMGAILTDVQRDFVSSLRLRILDRDSADERIRSAFAALESEALHWIGQEGDTLGVPEMILSADMRYVKQAFDMSISLPDYKSLASCSDAMTELYHREHERLYGYRDLKSQTEVVSVRLRVVARMQSFAMPKAPRSGAAASSARRKVFHEGRWIDVSVHERHALVYGQELVGPAIIEQEDSTCWILPGWAARTDEIGSLIMTASPSARPGSADETASR